MIPSTDVSSGNPSWLSMLLLLWSLSWLISLMMFRFRSCCPTNPHLYSIYINTLPALLRSAATRTTTMVSSLSPSGPPGPSGSGSSGSGLGLPFGPPLDVSVSHCCQLSSLR
ncbi:hypothetical protein G6F48_013607 [Rhizopus delemar]|nr:hypothetical protein G6F48_013607 [Rhizopus delemar]